MTDVKPAFGRGPPGKLEQLQYLLEWFQEFSSLQKEDFLHILTDKYSQCNLSTFPESLGSLQVGDRPPSIFQCRMKLFTEWFNNWSDEEKAELLIRLKMSDKNFMMKFEEIVANCVAE